MSYLNGSSRKGQGRKLAVAAVAAAAWFGTYAFVLAHLATLPKAEDGLVVMSAPEVVVSAPRLTADTKVAAR